MQAVSKLASLITFAGALLLVVVASLLTFGPAAQRLLYLQALIASAVTVLCFMGGIHWGIALSIAESAPHSAKSLLLLSIIPVLLCLPLLFIESARWQLLMSLSLFALGWMIDGLLYMQNLIPRWFFRLRCIAAPVAVLSLAAALFSY